MSSDEGPFSDLIWVLNTTADGRELPILCLVNEATIKNVNNLQYCYAGFGSSFLLNKVQSMEKLTGEITYESMGEMKPVIALLIPNNYCAGAPFSPRYFPPMGNQPDDYVKIDVTLCNQLVGSGQADRYDVYLPSSDVQILGSVTRLVNADNDRHLIWFPGGQGVALECPTIAELRANPALGMRLGTACYGEVRRCERLVRARNVTTEGTERSPIFTREVLGTPAYCAIKVYNEEMLWQLPLERHNLPEDPNEEEAALRLLQRYREPSEPRQGQREELMQNVTHHPFTEFVEASLDSERRCRFLVMKYYPRQDLRQYLMMEAFKSTAGVQPLARVKGLFRQLATGVRILHEQGIVHLDISPCNVLLAEHDVVPGVPAIVLHDFGLAQRAVMIDGVPQKLQFSKYNLKSGKATHRPPEYNRGIAQLNAPAQTASPMDVDVNAISSATRAMSLDVKDTGWLDQFNPAWPRVPIDGMAVDVWMLGMTLLILLTRDRLAPPQSPTLIEESPTLIEEYFQRRQVGDPEPSVFFGTLPLYTDDGRGGSGGTGAININQNMMMRRVAPQLFNMLSQMMRIDPAQRISSREICEHAWLTTDLD